MWHAFLDDLAFWIFLLLLLAIVHFAVDGGRRKGHDRSRRWFDD